MKRNGTAYELDENNDKSVLGTLYGSRLFEKNAMNSTWGINMERAIIWETAMLERIQARRPWETKSFANMLGSHGKGEIPYSPISMNFINGNVMGDTIIAPL
jgi:hypothetical protein